MVNFIKQLNGNWRPNSGIGPIPNKKGNNFGIIKNKLQILKIMGKQESHKMLQNKKAETFVTIK